MNARSCVSNDPGSIRARVGTRVRLRRLPLFTSGLGINSLTGARSKIWLGLRVLATCTTLRCRSTANPDGWNERLTLDDAERVDEMLVLASHQQRQTRRLQAVPPGPAHPVLKEGGVDIARALPAAYDVRRVAPGFVCGPTDPRTHLVEFHHRRSAPAYMRTADL